MHELSSSGYWNQGHGRGYNSIAFLNEWIGGRNNESSKI